jgi:hypothetical protein
MARPKGQNNILWGLVLLLMWLSVIAYAVTKISKPPFCKTTPNNPACLEVLK